MPMEVLVVQAGVERRHRIEVSGRETVVTLDLESVAEPDRVVLDPDGWVLEGGR